MSARTCLNIVLSAVAISIASSQLGRAQVPGEAPPAPANAPAAAAAPAAPAPVNGIPALAAGAQDPNQNPNGMEVLDQGPIHEAFADPVVLDAKPRMVIDREPPEPINEVPPQVQPEGDNIQWVPGYWTWSDLKGDFIWVSGVWRDVPPGRRWVPGNWVKDGAQWIWTSGFWAGAQAQDVQMLPHPPANLDAGPSSPAPGDNFFWIPGCWVWQNGAYAWRGGYWYAGQQNWVWVPDNYCYTPAGSIFVSGYWDRPLWSRGLVFAPVWWPARAFGYPAWSYQPSFAINNSLLLTSLFINTRCNNYWFGYGGWGSWGNNFTPWWNHRGGFRGYDPIWAYHRWHDGHHGDWDNHWRNQFNNHRHDFDLGRRPGNWGGNGNGPGNGRDPGNFAGGGRPGGVEAIADIVSVHHRGDRRGSELGGVKLRQVSNGQLQHAQSQISRMTEIRQVRAAAEVGGGVSGGSGPTNSGDNVQVRQRGGRGNAAAVAGGTRPGFRLPGTGIAEEGAGSAIQTGGSTAHAGSTTSAITRRQGGLSGNAGESVVGGERRTGFRGPGFQLPGAERAVTTGGATTGAGGAVAGGATGAISGDIRRQVQNGSSRYRNFTPPVRGDLGGSATTGATVETHSRPQYRPMPRVESSSQLPTNGPWGRDSSLWRQGGSGQGPLSGGGSVVGAPSAGSTISRGDFRPSMRGNFSGNVGGSPGGSVPQFRGGNFGGGGQQFRSGSFGGNAGGGGSSMFRSSGGGGGSSMFRGGSGGQMGGGGGMRAGATGRGGGRD